MNPKVISAALDQVPHELDPISKFLGKLLFLQGRLSPEGFEELLNLLYYYYVHKCSKDKVTKIFSAFTFDPNPKYYIDPEKAKASIELLLYKELDPTSEEEQERLESLVAVLLSLELEEDIITLLSLKSGEAIIIHPGEKLIFAVKHTKRGIQTFNLFEGYPSTVKILYDPMLDDTTYLLELHTKEYPFRKVLEGTFDEILKKIPYYGQKGQKEAYLRWILRALSERGFAELGVRDPPLGFSYNPLKDEILANIQFEEYNLREALELLKKHGEKFYKGLEPQFLQATVVSLLSPFSYLLRQLQLGAYVPYLYAWGDPGVGKTELLKNALYFYPSSEPIEKRIFTPGQLSTRYQLQRHLGKYDTLPVIVNEAKDVLDHFIEDFKALFESTILRARYESEIHGLRHPLFTSNHEPPASGGFERRTIIIYFGRPPLTKEEKLSFNREITPYRHIYQAIGKAFSGKFVDVVKKWKAGEIHLTQETLLEVAFNVLKSLYEEQGVSLPAWLDKSLLFEDTVSGVDYGVKLLSALKRILLDYVPRLGVKKEHTSPKSIVRELLESNSLPFAVYNGRAKSFNLLLTNALFDELKKYNIEHLSYDRIAELLRSVGVSAIVKKEGVVWNRRKYYGVSLDLEEFLNALFPPEESEEGETNIPALDIQNVIKAEILRLGQYHNLKPPREFIRIVLQNLRTSGYDVSEAEIYQALMELVLEGKAEVTPDYVNVLSPPPTPKESKDEQPKESHVAGVLPSFEELKESNDLGEKEFRWDDA